MFMKTAFCWLLILAGALGAAKAQNKYENLTVLPKDISKQELSSIMKKFSADLGVRCNFCHEGEANAPLSTYDFASDKNHHKEISREMIHLVNTINKKITEVIHDEGALEVTCRTCHRGVVHPRTLQQELARANERKGITSAVERYTKLRERYYGKDSYNFGEGSLISFGKGLLDGGKLDEAAVILELNASHFPKSSATQAQLGEVHARKGDKAKAVTYMEKALSLDPNNRFAKKRLAELKK